MKLSIITINYNNAEGLRKTLASVASQTFRDFEHIIVDGGSTDGSVEIIREYTSANGAQRGGCQTGQKSQTGRTKECPQIRWISEKDRGIYDAQNKGIRLAHGEYCYFLNAGDTFCNEHVLELIFKPLTFNLSPLTSTPDILYGNEVIVDGNGQHVGIARGVANPSFVDLYNSCMKHQASFIRRDLFEQYGMYDDTMRICADFDWFFRVIAFHDDVTLQYKDVDIAYFENTGLSYHAPEVCAKERQHILDRYMSKRMQRDYAVLGKYPRLSRVGENKMVKLLLRIANKLLK